MNKNTRDNIEACVDKWEDAYDQRLLATLINNKNGMYGARKDEDLIPVGIYNKLSRLCSYCKGCKTEECQIKAHEEVDTIDL
jgi:hypothetical protein